MPLFKFKFKLASEPIWSRLFRFNTEADFRAHIAEVFPNIPALEIREASAFERAEQLVSDFNERNVSMIYGQGALVHVKTMFGCDSEEAKAYEIYLRRY